ncbi:MAG: hypothetical protein LUC24_06825 [Bacteroidales bacterium]|nr:hypothetical protein [Bacteroidales bacterium]
MNGNISPEGLTKDLEYMKAAGYGAAMIFNAGCGIPRGPVDFNSAEWKNAVIKAMRDAQRLDIQLFMHNSPGYSGTGGPWISVENSMKELVWTDTFVTSDGKMPIEADLPQPCSKMGFYRDAYILAYPSLPDEVKAFRDLITKVTLDGREIDAATFADNDWNTQTRIEGGKPLTFELNEPLKAQSITIYRGDREQPLDPHDGPRDYPPSILLETSQDGTNFTPIGAIVCPALRAMDAPASLSFPTVEAKYFRLTPSRGTNLAEVELHASPRLDGYAAKANYTGTPVTLEDNPQQVPENQIIQSNSVIDLTAATDTDGHLRWNAPTGRWTIVRIGYTTTGETVGAAPDSGEGLDCDKFSKAGVDEHFDKFLDPLLNDLSPWCGTTLEGLVIDSWEAGKQNWTEELPDYFKERRGYDIMPYLLAATGRIVDGVGDTNRFLWDLRRTHSDMFIENYVERFRERAARHGLRYAGEAYGDGNFESLEMAARQDWPMSEFWTHYVYGNIATTMLASSSGHVWGRPIIACECFTGTPFNSKFTEHPYGMKALGDYILTAGVNRFVYHATTHQPYTGSQKGNIMTMGPFGTHFDRASMRVEPFAAFNLYFSRCAYMLRQGLYAADVLYLKDEAISSGVNNYNTAYPATPYGYRWDIAGTEALQQRLSVQNGRITLPDGMSYSLLVVTPIERTSPETLQKIIDLVRQGMTIVLAGDRPKGYLGLDRDKDAKVRELADLLWSSDTLGSGRIYHKEDIINKGQNDLSGILLKMGIQPDFSFTAENKDAQIHFIHRTVNNDEIYFVTNHRRRSENLTITCRTSGKTPALWNAETGETGIPVEYEQTDGTTKINLHLQESGSVFIVFRDSADVQTVQTTARENLHKTAASQEIRNTTITEVTPKPSSVHTHAGDIDYNPDRQFNSTFTISLWAKPETFAYGNRGCVVYPADGVGDIAYIGISIGQNRVFVYENNGGNWRTAIACTRPIEGWTHVGLVYIEGIPYLYIDGNLVATGERSAFDCRPSMDVPMAEEQYICSFEGDQTKTEVYDYALTAEEINDIAAAGAPDPKPKSEVLKDLSDGWTVYFPEYGKAPTEIALPRLESLHKNDDFNVSHFSGTATYVRHFTVKTKELKGKRLMLNLGRVENTAEVSVNGGEPIVLWKAPFEADITDLLTRGDNVLTIKVTNLLPNRIIGDEHLPEKYDYDEYGRIRALPQWYLDGQTDERERVLFLPWKFYTKDDPLLESGLIGTVTLTARP